MPWPAHGQGTIRYVNLGGVQFPSAAAGSVTSEYGRDTPVDFDGNGVVDLVFRNRSSFQQFIVPSGDNAVLARPIPPPDVTSDVVPLALGHMIGPNVSGSLNWVPARPSGNPLIGPLGPYLSACYDFGCVGLFAGQTAYMGVQFEIDNQTHYGWMHLRSEAAGSVVHGFAYNTVPREPILAGQVPEPAIVTLTLFGAAVLWASRKFSR